MENTAISKSLLKGVNLSREAIVKQTTDRLLRYALRATGTKLILILGHLRSGKSSLFESLTGETGHSKKGIDSVTKEYQVGSAHINGKLYLFVDTPGLNDAEVSNESILEEIAKLLDMTKNSVTYAGVLYVHPATLQFSKEVKQSLQFLALFCGRDYFPQITFVTTFWDDIAPSQIEAKNELISELAQYKWSSFLSCGAEIYHHGRVYEGEKPTLDTLSLKDHPELRQIQAREVIARLYPVDRVYTAPLIIIELRARIPLEDTRVGQFARKTDGEPYGASRRLAGHGRPLMLGQSEPSGFNWFNAIAAAIKFPFEKVAAFLGALLEFVTRLEAAIMKLIPKSLITVSLPYLNGHGVEVLFTIVGGISFTVGYGLYGPYMGPFHSPVPTFNSNTTWHDGAPDESDMEGHELGQSSAAPKPRRVWDMEGDESNPEYQTVRAIFEGMTSASDDASPLNPPEQPAQETNQEQDSRERTPENDLWWWQRCVTM